MIRLSFPSKAPLLGLIFWVAMGSTSAQTVEAFLQNRPLFDKKRLYYTDLVYESKFRSVQLYPDTGTPDATLLSPIVPLSQSGRLTLTFDELGDNAGYYEAKIIHCNQDWQPSMLRPIEYLSAYNEFDLQDFAFSVNTRVNYTHFRLQLPAVKASGNYLLKVFREGNEDDVIITKRFVVYEEASQIGITVRQGNGSEGSQRNQLVQFEAIYQLPLIMPQQSVTAVIRQNQRWDNALYNIPPIFVRENEQRLEFTYFNGETEFEGGNEFRFFDTRPGFGGGFQVKAIKQFVQAWEAFLYADTPWDRVYNQQRQDHNGTYFIASQAGNPAIEADYFIVEFTLASGNSYEQAVYVLGSFNQWQPSAEYRMEYLSEMGAYKLRTLLKQGLCDYRYVLLNEQAGTRSDHTIDGTHSRTGNTYEVILYYRGAGERADRAIGYQRITN